MTKQKIQTRNSALKAKWTQINEKFTKIFQEEIDWDIECRLLIESGWTKVKISQDGMNIVEKWVEENIQGKYTFHRTTWFFESEKDATMFILRWS
jgi:hypothetical protein